MHPLHGPLQRGGIEHIARENLISGSETALKGFGPSGKATQGTSFGFKKPEKSSTDVSRGTC
jgi:hypothetical protein